MANQNLILDDSSVSTAFSPYFIDFYFVRNGTQGWKSLRGILLAFTVAEALFVDLGAFTWRAVQLSWLCFAYPCLLLAYIGQVAYISHDRTA
jgi:KUP system potassium uptake protein